jgi:hypothetical protein
MNNENIETQVGGYMNPINTKHPFGTPKYWEANGFNTSVPKPTAPQAQVIKKCLDVYQTSIKSLGSVLGQGSPLFQQTVAGLRVEFAKLKAGITAVASGYAEKGQA